MCRISRRQYFYIKYVLIYCLLHVNYHYLQTLSGISCAFCFRTKITIHNRCVLNVNYLHDGSIAISPFNNPTMAFWCAVTSITAFELDFCFRFTCTLYSGFISNGVNCSRIGWTVRKFNVGKH